jgi:hypothetical protein
MPSPTSDWSLVIEELKQRCFHLLNSNYKPVWQEPRQEGDDGTYEANCGPYRILYDGVVDETCEFGGANSYTLEVGLGFILIFQEHHTGPDESKSDADAWRFDHQWYMPEYYESEQQVHTSIKEALNTIRQHMILDDLANA